MNKKVKARIVRGVSYALLALGAIVMLAPFIWMLTTSVKDISDVFVYPPKLFGKTVVWQNYLRISDRFSFPAMFMNTVKVTAAVVAGQLATSAMAGYAFGCLRFKGKNLLFMAYLASMMIPFHVMLVPTFDLLKRMNLLNNLWALILPVLISPFGAFLMKQFFLSIPLDLAESAKIDGCNPWRIFTAIYLPLSKPALATLGIFTFVSTWNDFLRPLIFLNDSKDMTLTLGIYAMQGVFSTDWSVLMATCTLSLLPALILFLSMQDLFVEGIAMTGLKG